MPREKPVVIHDRHSTARRGYRAHDRKEGAAGGWGIPGEEVDAVEVLDESDPIFESIEDVDIDTLPMPEDSTEEIEKSDEHVEHEVPIESEQEPNTTKPHGEK